MAEAIAAVGLGASVISFIQLAASVSTRISDFYDASQDVPRALQDIADQLPLIKIKTKQISQACDRGDVPKSDQDALRGAVDGCVRQVRELDKILVSCLPVKANSPFGKKDNKAKVLLKAFRSMLNDKDLKRILQCLMGHETLLTLYAANFSPSANQTTINQVVSIQADANQATGGRTTKRNDSLHFEVTVGSVTKFIGRAALMKDIAASFTAENRTVVLLGMGGQGKTQTALHFCLSVRPECSVYWVDATNTRMLNQGFERLFNIFVGRNPRSDDDVRQEVFRYLNSLHSPFLLVFDNFDSPKEVDDITKYIPQMRSNDRVLFTSRHGDSRNLGTTIDVPPMDMNDGTELLFYRSRCPRTPASEKRALEIVERLNGLALAIDQAGAYILSRTLPLENFLDHYEHRRDIILKHTPTVWPYQKLSDSETATRTSVFTTWELSLSELGVTDEDRQPYIDYLTTVAFMNFKSVSKLSLKKYFERIEERPAFIKLFGKGGVWDDYQYQDFVVQLAQVSLIQSVDVSNPKMNVTIHPLVAEWLRLRNGQAERKKYCRRVIDILMKSLKSWRFEWFDRKEESDELYAHVSTCLANDIAYFNGTEESISDGIMKAVELFSDFYILIDHYSDAKRLLDRAEHVVKADVVAETGWNNSIGFLYYLTKQPDKAKEPLRFVFKKYTERYGQYHGKTHYAARQLAKTYIELERWDEGAELLKPILDWCKDVGNQEKEDLPTRRLYGRVLCGKGDFDAGIEELSSVLKRYQKIDGENGLSALSLMHELAYVHNKNEQPERAEELYRQCLWHSEASLGRDDSDTLTTALELARTLEKQDKSLEAMPLLERVYRGWELMFGRANAVTLETAQDLWGVYCKVGDVEAAERMLELVLSAGDALGQKSPEVVTKIASRAMRNYFENGDNARANAVYDRVEPLFEGDDDLRWRVALLRSIRAQNYQAEGDYHNALRLYELAAKGYDVEFGEDNERAMRKHRNVAEMRALLKKLPDRKEGAVT